MKLFSVTSGWLLITQVQLVRLNIYKKGNGINTQTSSGLVPGSPLGVRREPGNEAIAINLGDNLRELFPKVCPLCYFMISEYSPNYSLNIFLLFVNHLNRFRVKSVFMIGLVT